MAKSPMDKVVNAAVKFLEAWDKSDDSPKAERLIADRIAKLADAIADLAGEPEASVQDHDGIDGLVEKTEASA